MTSFASKHNSQGRLFTFEIPKNFEYKNAREIHNQYSVGTIHKVNAIYINTKGIHGDAPVLVTDNELVNAPQHMTTVANEILADAESVGLINRGYVGFKTYEYDTDKYGKQIGIEWVDIVPNDIPL